jgi:hypothetical protein
MYTKYLGVVATLALCTTSCDSTGFSGSHQRRSVSKPRQAEVIRPEVEPPKPAEQPPIDPCSKQGATVEHQESAKQIFFYAPNDPNHNPYFTPIIQQLTSSGYKVNVSDTISASVKGELDGCKLWASYKQIWLWLPCKDGNIAKSMDPASQTALKEFYEGGGGLAVFPDSHFDNNGGNHCSMDGSWGNSSDIRLVESMLGIDFSYGGLMTAQPKARGDHPFALARVGIRPSWPVTVKASNPLWQSLDFNESSGVIEKDLQDGTKSVALVIANTYNYHGLSTGDATPFVQIADYFESAWGKHSKTEGSSFALNQHTWVPLPVKHYFADEVRKNLQSSDPVTVANALTYGAQMGDLKMEEVASYLGNEEFRIRINAASALCTIAQKLDSVKPMLAQFAKAELSERRLQGYTRAFGCAGNRQALPALKALAASGRGAKFQSELNHAIQVLEAKQ